MRASVRTGWSAVVLALAGLGAGCGGGTEQPPGSVMLVVEADERLKEELQCLDFAFRAGDALDALAPTAMGVAPLDVARGAWPVRALLTSTTPQQRRYFEVVVQGYRGACPEIGGLSPVVVAGRRSAFLPGERRTVTVRLTAACLDQACDPGQVCVEGTCTEPPLDLPPSDGGVDGGRDGATDGGRDAGGDGGVECTGDMQCDDDNPCTADRCQAGRCVFEPQEGVVCDDGVYCNGPDHCDASGACVPSGEAPCLGSTTCDEDMDTCTGCTEDADCPSMVTGPWSACSTMAGADEGDAFCNGTRQRTVTSYTCDTSTSTCQPSETTEQEACTLNEGNVCARTCDEWGMCSGFDDDCDATGTQRRSCTVSTCSTGSCVAGTSTVETQVCRRMPPGTDCCMVSFVALTAGPDHTCATDAMGRTWCWGRNIAGQLGIGSTTDTGQPTLVRNGASPMTFNVVSAGGAHTCGVDRSSKPWCWGSCVRGRLGLSGSSSCDFLNVGNGEPTFYASPQQVSVLTTAAVIAAGGQQTCAATAAGKLYCWGLNEDGQLGIGASGGYKAQPQEVMGISNVKQIALGGYHTCVVDTSRRLYCWGKNYSGQLGLFESDGSPSSSQPSPPSMPLLTNVVQVAAGTAHTCAIVNDGASKTLHCWGKNMNGELGQGTLDSVAEVVQVDPDPSTDPWNDVQAVVAGGDHTCAVRSGGRLYCWGRNDEGQAGTGDTVGPVTTPSLVASVSNVVAVAVGQSHTCALDGDGFVWCWGLNTSGQLGRGATSSMPETTPALIAMPDCP